MIGRRRNAGTGASRAREIEDAMESQVTQPDEVALRAKLAELTQEHRDLDNAIAALTESGARDQLQLTRLKKRKLQLKDEISKINDRLLPDIIA
jgi:hypothetical protein